MKAGGRDTTCPVPGQYSLYRFYDAREELLYVGISNEPWRRRKQHSVTQPWYPLVRFQTIEWLDGEAAASRAERSAIRRERPLYNIAGAIEPPPVPRRRLGLRPRRWITRAIFTALWAWAAIFERACCPALAAPLVACEYLLLFAALAHAAGYCLLASGPSMRRLGTWIERNTTGASWPRCRQSGRA